MSRKKRLIPEKRKLFQLICDINTNKTVEYIYIAQTEKNHLTFKKSCGII